MRSKSTTAGLLASLFLAATFMGPMLSSTTAAQTPKKAGAAKGKVEKVHAQKSRGGGGADENIKSDSDANDPGKQMPAPGNKGGEKSKGAGDCAVVVDNRTGWYVRIFVDGTYRGTIAPWGDAYCYTGAGSTRLYAVATFTTGERFTWGPGNVNCYGRYSWQLHP
ncbi:MAG: hypothetical protein AABN33_25320 [Acidobacteriota bacterium]